MENILQKLEDPIVYTQPEPFHWEVLSKAFITDPTINFWFDGKIDEKQLSDFFEAVVHDVLISGGKVFSTQDKKAVFVWAFLGNDPQDTNEYKKKWQEILGKEGLRRYYWLYEAGEITFDETKIKKSVEPAYLAVLPGAQGLGYGSHIFKWSLDYFDKLGFYTPFILASTQRSAKLYCPLLGFEVHKEVFIDKDDKEPIGVFLKRIE